MREMPFLQGVRMTDKSDDAEFDARAAAVKATQQAIQSWLEKHAPAQAYSYERCGLEPTPVDAKLAAPTTGSAPVVSANKCVTGEYADCNIDAWNQRVPTQGADARPVARVNVLDGCSFTKWLMKLPDGLHDLYIARDATRNDVIEQCAQIADEMVLYTGYDVAQRIRALAQK
jgi:hypothetical protein